MSTIELHGITKSFGATSILRGVDLVVSEGSVTAVLGASGSGKTTLLRIIAGFEHVDAGRVSIAGRIVDDGSRAVPAQHRGVGYVPQEGALFPHLTVMGNIGFGVPRAERSRLGGLVELVGLGGLGRRYPHQLSGGQQQRVALARALAIRPSVVLLDEPFSSLDASLRTGLRRDVARVLAETGTTAILVTHDQGEALGLADQVAVLRQGRVVASTDPYALYQEPPDAVAALSIGEANLLLAEVRGSTARCVLGAVVVDNGDGAPPAGPVRLLLRPEQLVLHADATLGGVAAVVTDTQFHGHDTLVDLVVEQPHHQELLARVPGDVVVAPGQAVWVQVQGAARAWKLDDVRAGPAPDDTLWAGARRSAAPAGATTPAPPGVAPPVSPPGGARGAGRRRSRRARSIGLVAALLVVALVAVVTALLVSGDGPSASSVGPVVFHAVIDTTGRVRMTDPFTDTTTAKKVPSCARAAETGDDPTIAPRTWYVPTPPLSNTAEIEIGTIARGFHGAGRYPQSALELGSGVLGIGQEDYNLASQYAKASMTVDPDGSGVVTFTHAPGDDDVPGPGFHGGITGTITWTCTS